MSGPVSSAVISEAVSRITSLLTGKYSEHNNVQEWIDRMVMAQIQIESAVKESEEFDINNDEPLHKWQEKLKEALCEAEEVLSIFQAEILHEEPNQTIEGGHTASNLEEAVTRQVNLEANLPHDPFMQEEGSDDATLVHTASNLTEAVTRQVDQQANLPHDPLMQEEGLDDATLVHTASNLTEAVTCQVDLQANLPLDQPMQEEGSDGATLVHPSINLLKAVIRQIEQQPNLPQGSDDATSVHTSSNLTEAFPCPANTVFQMAQLVFELFNGYGTYPRTFSLPSPWPAIIDRLSAFSRLLDPRTFSLLDPRMMVVKYLENDEKVSKLLKTVEKLEKMAGNIGNFIKLLELQKKRKMSRKRKRSGVALQGFFLVIPLKLQTYALFSYGEDPYLLVIKMFRANCTVPSGITGGIFIRYIM